MKSYFYKTVFLFFVICIHCNFLEANDLEKQDTIHIKRLYILPEYHSMHSSHGNNFLGGSLQISYQVNQKYIIGIGSEFSYSKDCRADFVEGQSGLSVLKTNLFSHRRRSFFSGSVRQLFYPLSLSSFYQNHFSDLSKLRSFKLIEINT